MAISMPYSLSSSVTQILSFWHETIAVEQKASLQNERKGDHLQARVIIFDCLSNFPRISILRGLLSAPKMDSYQYISYETSHLLRTVK